MGRIDYYKRIFSAYLTKNQSQLTFWHEKPEVNENFESGKLGEYYMTFFSKADYPGSYDDKGIPLLDYRGVVGLQYNPIAIAQYGLGNYNLYSRTRDKGRKAKFLNAADWLVENLEETEHKTKVWHHHFDWEYRDMLKAPWYSALAQGQGISLLVRAHKEVGEDKYIRTAKEALDTFNKRIDEGGVTYIDERNNLWFEEYIVDPPTHILNGFIWSLWGIYDYHIYTGDAHARYLFNEGIETLSNNLHTYDAGFWSLYEHSGTRMKMLASPFYHDLHIVQLQILNGLTERPLFEHYAGKWSGYRNNFLKRKRALLYKAIFKVLYY